MNTHENTRVQVPACQGVDCAALDTAQDWFGDVECRAVAETQTMQAHRDVYGDFA